MADLITLAQYKSFVPSTLTTDEALISILIPVATKAIDRYTDRHLVEATYTEWVRAAGQAGVFFPHEYPCKAVYAALRADPAATVANSGTIPLTLVFSEDQLTVYATLTGVTKSYTYATHANVSTLFAAVTADYPALTFTLSVDGTLLSTLLYPTSLLVGTDGTTIEIRAACTPINAQIDQHGRILYATGMSVGGFDTIGGYEANRDGQTTNIGNICLVYTAGFNPVPGDLQMIAANVVRDMVQIQKNRRQTGVKSETISQYKYDNMDNVDYDNLVRTKYAGALSPFRRTVF